MRVSILWSFISIISSIHALLEKFTYHVKEETSPTTLIGNVAQSLRLDIVNSQITKFPYNFGMTVDNHDIKQLFSINPIDGKIHTNVSLDRDSFCLKHKLCCRTNTDCKIAFKVYYTLRENQISKINYCQVVIIVEDINDNAPEFNVSHYTVDISESSQIGSQFSLPVAKDRDAGAFGVQEYRIDGGRNLFVARFHRLSDEEIVPKLELNDRLDREVTNKYTMTLVAIDAGNPPKSGTVTLFVIVVDENDNTPEVIPTYDISVKEDTPINTIIGRIKATDADIGNNARLTYSFSENASRKVTTLFAVDPSKGEVKLISRLDYDEGPTPSYTLPFLVRDNGKPPRSVSTTMNIRIIDVNDEWPQITVLDLKSRNPARPEVMENKPSGAFVAFVTVKDRDSGSNGEVTCRLDNPNFRLILMSSNPDNGDTEYNVQTEVKLDREMSPRQTISIQCTDKGIPQKSNETTIVVEVLDENDNQPKFDSNQLVISVSENAPPGTYVAMLNASDADQIRLQPQSYIFGADGGIKYTLDSEGNKYFRIEPRSGKLFTKILLDREEIEEIRFKVTATDSGKPPSNTTVDVRATVLDQNDCAPVFKRKEYRLSVEESRPVGYTIGSIQAEDRDTLRNGKFKYHLHDIKGSSQRSFVLDKLTGDLRIKHPLDREVISKYHFIVKAVDEGDPIRHTGETSVTIEVLDVNDNAPKFIYPTQLNHTVYSSVYNTQGTGVVKLTAVDDDSDENKNLVFFILSGNEKNLFELDPKNGDITLFRDLTTSDAGTYQLELEVRDNGSPKSLSSKSNIRIVLDTTTRKVSGVNDKGRGLARRRNDSYFGDFGSDKNMIMVICLVIAATLLAIIFMLIVLYLRRKPGGLLLGGPGNGRGGGSGRNGARGRLAGGHETSNPGGFKKEIHHLVSVHGSARALPGGGQVKSNLYHTKDPYGSFKFSAGTIPHDPTLSDHHVCDDQLCSSGNHGNTMAATMTRKGNGGQGRDDGNINYYHQIACQDDYHTGSLFTYGDLTGAPDHRGIYSSRIRNPVPTDTATYLTESNRTISDPHTMSQYQTLQKMGFSFPDDRTYLPESQLRKLSIDAFGDTDAPCSATDNLEANSDRSSDGAEKRQLLLHHSTSLANNASSNPPTRSSSETSGDICGANVTFNYSILPIIKENKTTGNSEASSTNNPNSSVKSKRKPYNIVASSFV